MSELCETVFDIQRGSFVDGPGIRTTVFFKGCNLSCKWCHNPEGISSKKQLLFHRDKCTHCQKCKSVCKNSLEFCDLCGKCTLFCPSGAREICGKTYTPPELLKEIVKDKSFFDASGGGVTFSGGECMLNCDFLLEILKLCKENKIHTAIDTAGNVPWESFEGALDYTDLFLYDIKCVSGELHKRGTGVSNELIIENLKRLSDTYKGDIIIRVPLIGGFNDTDEEITRIGALLNRIRHKSVELLPYHKMGEHKYDALNIPFTKFYTPNESETARFKQMLGITKIE